MKSTGKYIITKIDDEIILDEKENLIESGRQIRFYLKTDGHEELPLAQFCWMEEPGDATKFDAREEADAFINDKENELLGIGCEVIEYIV